MTDYLHFVPMADGSWKFPPGIYFGMPDELYHSDPALGSTKIKAIAIDPYEFQFDRLYGEDKDTDAVIFGSALHARILEGETALYRKFCREFDKTEFEGALDTITDLKAFLQKHGQVGISGKAKPALIQHVLDIDPTQKIVDVIKGEWDRANEGKTALKPKRWAQIEAAARWVQRDPLLAPVMQNGTFTDGAPEVSIFYEDRGVRLKCRFDRLLRHAIIDAKSFAPRSPGRIEGLAKRAIVNMRYDIQAADYLRGWAKAKEMYLAGGAVYGDQPFPSFLEECFDREEPKWIWIMVKSTGAPQPLVISWNATLAKRTAAEEVETAIETYIELRDRYGDDAEWTPMRPAMNLTDSDLPIWMANP